jgi:hypothetical protein
MQARCPHYRDFGLDLFTTDLGLLYNNPAWVVNPYAGRMPALQRFWIGFIYD